MAQDTIQIIHPGVYDGIVIINKEDYDRKSGQRRVNPDGQRLSPNGVILNEDAQKAEDKEFPVAKPAAEKAPVDDEGGKKK